MLERSVGVRQFGLGECGSGHVWGGRPSIGKVQHATKIALRHHGADASGSLSGAEKLFSLRVAQRTIQFRLASQPQRRRHFAHGHATCLISVLVTGYTIRVPDDKPALLNRSPS